MPGKRSFDQQLATLDELKHQSPEAVVEPLRKALTQRNNYLVAKAADLAAKFRLVQLLPELLVAFDRFFTDPLKTDPQCWAKNALSHALAALGCQDVDVFLHSSYDGFVGGAMQARVDDVHAGVPQAARDHLGSPVMAIQTDLCD